MICRVGAPSVAIFSLFVAYVFANKAEVEKHLERGKHYLSEGNFADALSSYHAALELDPDNYQTLYRRATVYLATGHSKAAIPDLDRVVEIKPDFTAARVQRGNVLLKQGDLEGARRDYEAAKNVDSANAEAAKKLEILDDLKQFVEQAKIFYEDGDYASADFYLSKSIEHMVWDGKLYRMRAKCYRELGQIQKAIADLRNLAKLYSDSTEVFLEISQLYYGVGDVEESLTQIRECLKLNPDHKECFKFYKGVKKLAKMREQLANLVQKQQWMDCLEKGRSILKHEKTVSVIQLDVFRHTCKCNREAGHVQEAIQECTEVLNNGDENDVDMLCERAEAHLINDDYDAAIADFQKALKSNEESRKAKEGLQKAERMKKQASRRDYYKILGVKRNANKREVTKAYRKLAQQWHPDNFSEDDEKAEAQKKFIDIAAAKEVLTDEEKRRQFDAGVDPLDPEAQQGHHGHHGGFHHYQQGGFPHGFDPFGEGGGSFKFHF